MLQVRFPRKSRSAGPHCCHPRREVELKTETGRLSKVQKWQRSELEKRGAEVRVLFGLEAVKDFVREVFADAVHTP